jgi:predicted RNase H-like nuclease (RuvC/YqgF family)
MKMSDEKSISDYNIAYMEIMREIFDNKKMNKWETAGYEDEEAVVDEDIAQITKLKKEITKLKKQVKKLKDTNNRSAANNRKLKKEIEEYEEYYDRFDILDLGDE